MSEKNLTELEWRKFAKGKDLKDAALVKALAALEKARNPQLSLDALAEIEKQADTLRKAGKGDKELAAYLDGLDKALDRQRKASELEARKAATSSDEEEDSPALLTTKLVPLIRELRKGEVELPALIAAGGREAAVLISRRAISPSRRKLLADYLGDGGTPKYLVGHCLWEAGSLTFVVPTQPGGLAKKLRAALLKQTDLRIKVRVRGDDGSVDDDGEPPEQEAGEGESQEPTSAGTPEPSTQADPLQAEFERRLAEARARLATDAQGPQATKMQAVVDFASGRAAAGQFRAALQALDQLDKLSAASATAPPPEAPVGAQVSLVKLQQARLAWEKVRKQVQAELTAVSRELRAAVLAHNEEEEAEDEYEQGDLDEGVDVLDTMLGALDERLLDALDDALNAGAEQRPARLAQAAGILAEYRAYMASSELLAAIDGNPFRPCRIRRDLDTALKAVAAAV